MPEEKDTSGNGGSDIKGDYRLVVQFKNVVKFINEMLPAAFSISVVLVLLVGWRLRRFEFISPEQGAGFAMGVMGTAAMGILLIYPLRKRVRGLDKIGSVKNWFRFHMILGILGPVMILFHCNFRLGSLNSNVALFSMLTVSISGIMGRYIYSRIHHGLYGQRAGFLDLVKDFEQTKSGVEMEFSLIPGIHEALEEYSKVVLNSSSSVLQSIWGLLSVRLSSWKAIHKVSKMTAKYLSGYAAEHHWVGNRKKRMQKQIERKAWRFINQALKVSEFNFYERVFALWHMLHLPLVFILAIAIVFHVIAVNRY
jgi:hypothetical protein